MTDTLLLLVGFFYTFFLPGFVIIETFFPRIIKISKPPLYMILSVLVSTYLVYFLSLAFGFSRYTIITSFLLFCFWGVLLFVRKKVKLKKIIPDKKHLAGLGFSLVVFVLFFTALYPGIFTQHNGHFVLSAVNWQDTAMHLGIIESISEGNFPPQAPYYAGQPLSYYYFSDFHSAILNKLYGNFFPRVLVYDNPFFVFSFSLSVYALVFYLTKKRIAALFSSMLAVFSSNYMFIRFFEDVIAETSGNLHIKRVLDLLTNKGYTLEAGGVMRMVPMTDYFLQNRPMMIGLPSVVLVGFLVFYAYKENKNEVLVLAGLLSALLSKFQFFSFFVCLGLFILISLIFYKKVLKKRFKSFLYFFAPVTPSILWIITTSVGNRTLNEVFLKNFQWGPWKEGAGVFWYLKFMLVNFGLPFIFALIFTPILYFKNKKKRKVSIFLGIWLITMCVIPHVAKFTIYIGDMFKFFYFMMIPTTIISGIVLEKVWTNKKNRELGIVLVTFILFVSFLTSFIALSSSFLNKSRAYTMSEYKVGVWIRKNIPKRSVFISYPTVHTPITQIGGRLRVLSYINWPYSHGFNTGEDSVFSRLRDIEEVFDPLTDASVVFSIAEKYNARYIYYGREERANFPEAGSKFDSISELRTVYSFDAIKIYEIK